MTTRLEITTGPEDLCDSCPVDAIRQLLARRRWQLSEFMRLHAPQDIIDQERRLVTNARLALSLKTGRRNLRPDIE